MEHPYIEYENTKTWKVLSKLIQDLVSNQDLKILTPMEYVIGYLCKGLNESRNNVFPIIKNNEYEATRLLFRANVIEMLNDSDIFRIHTPQGTFSMTKADFYRVFSNVVGTKSYKEKGIYHYPTIPSKALQFLNE